jgi:hypothetical protein
VPQRLIINEFEIVLLQNHISLTNTETLRNDSVYVLQKIFRTLEMVKTRLETDRGPHARCEFKFDSVRNRVGNTLYTVL